MLPLLVLGYLVTAFGPGLGPDDQLADRAGHDVVLNHSFLGRQCDTFSAPHFRQILYPPTVLAGSRLLQAFASDDFIQSLPRLSPQSPQTQNPM